ncbi:two-component system response regulator [Aliidiomarina taiwanensis]|uniref:Two-component system response regulator n=1 Tax=Aliidiomarina taiwanensis TaxID=946228 RepID=A0A432X1S7_9GAMM|nr:response regulator [Aliidiomarina taiwanensis]RUO40516.1 two-component system response regulator [Aliidiomarina taiwanensis]
MTNILIADDDFISLEVLKAMLAQYAVTVHTAADGQAAVDTALQVTPALIILDYEMPKLTGAEACKQLRQHAVFADTPIIALTGHQSPTEIEACRAAGMNHTLHKPVSPDALQDLFSTYLPELL